MGLFAVLAAATSTAGAAPSRPELAAPADRWPDLRQVGAVQGGGDKDAAVIVGIEDYVFAPDVPGARSNAEAWYQHLTSVRGVPATKVRLLRNEEATVEELRASAKAAAGDVQPGGTLWFVFIGHGAPAAAGDDGLLIGADAQQTATGLETRSLRRSELLKTLENGAGQPVVVLDACFSGRGTQGESLAKGLQPLRLAKLRQPTTAVVLTAAQSNQYAGALPGAGVPAFSYLVLGAMRGWADDNGDGRVTSEEAVRYSDAIMRTTIKGRSQTPDVGGSKGKVLGRTTERGPDLAAITLASVSAKPTDAYVTIVCPSVEAAKLRGLGLFARPRIGRLRTNRRLGTRPTRPRSCGATRWRWRFRVGLGLRLGRLFW